MDSRDLAGETATRPSDARQHRVPRRLPRELLRTGRVSVTPDALTALIAAGATVNTVVEHHHHADWGDAAPSRGAANDLALLRGGEVLSTYQILAATSVWVRTTPDRSATMVTLAPEL